MAIRPRFPSYVLVKEKTFSKGYDIHYSDFFFTFAYLVYTSAFSFVKASMSSCLGGPLPTPAGSLWESVSESVLGIILFKLQPGNQLQPWPVVWGISKVVKSQVRLFKWLVYLSVGQGNTLSNPTVQQFVKHYKLQSVFPKFGSCDIG